MFNEQFNKGKAELNSVHLTEAEKARILEEVFKAPIKSPYYTPKVFALVRSKYVMIVLLLALSLSVSGAVVQASNAAVPGDKLYPVKTKVVEPILDVVNSTSPERKLEWQETKVLRRISEAETLAVRNELDDKKVEDLTPKIEHDSEDFVSTANTVASSTKVKHNLRERITATSTEVFRKEERKGDTKGDNQPGNQRDNVEKIKRAAIQVVDHDNENDNEKASQHESRGRGDRKGRD